ncbi:MAG: phosphatase [bacterium]|nr:phosphatase [bacterium]
MKIIADLHTHTIASTHAYSTVTEMAQAAADAGLYALALTDHGRKMPGAPGAYYFESLGLIPKELFGVRMLKGMEANITDYEGNIDCEDSLASKLDWIVASMHTITIEGQPSFEKCTNAYLKLADNQHINAVGHSGTEVFKYDYEKVIPQLAKNGILIEINNSTFNFKKSSMSNCIDIIKICKKNNARIVVDTDAHFSTYVGRAEPALKVLKDLDFPQKLIVNGSVETMQAYMKEKNIEL